MKKFCTLLLLMIGLPLLAQMNPENHTAQVIAYWDKGDNYSYTVDKEKFEINGSDTIRTKAYHYQLDFVVKDSTANSYTVEMVVKNYFKKDFLNDAEDWQYLPGMDLTFVYRTDELGSFEQLLNEEYVLAYSKMSSRMAGVSDEVYERIAQTFSHNFIVESAMQLVTFFHNFYGFTLDENKPVILKDQLMERNELGIKKLKYDLEIHLTELDREDSTYLISYYEDYQPISGEFLNPLMEQLLGQSLDKKAKKEFKNMQLKLDTWQNMRMHNSGVPLAYYFGKTVKVVFNQEEKNTLESIYMVMN